MDAEIFSLTVGHESYCDRLRVFTFRLSSTVQPGPRARVFTNWADPGPNRSGPGRPGWTSWGVVDKFWILFAKIGSI